MQDTKRRLVERGYKKPVLLLHPLGEDARPFSDFFSILSLETIWLQ